MPGKTYIDLNSDERLYLGSFLFDAQINSLENDHLADFGRKLRKSLQLKNAHRTTSTPINKAEAYVLGKTVLALWEYWPADRFHKRNLLSASLKLIEIGSVRPGKRPKISDSDVLKAFERAKNLIFGQESPLESVCEKYKIKDIRTVQRAIKREKARRAAIGPATKLLLNISE